MNLYAQISKNKIKTFLIISLFIFLISGFFCLIGLYFDSAEGYFMMGLIISLLSGVGSYFYSDKLVLATTGAKPANREEHFDLYTVVENLSIAAGMPMPKVYVINDESPNAFATGRNPKHAVVAATTGLLSKLDRGELEGVIGHELSHIRNYDILLSSIVAVLVGMIAFVADWIMRVMWWGGEDSDNRGKSPILFALMVIALILTPIAATLIQLAVSRRREFLADASGVLLTRSPDNLAQALEKIASDPKPVRRVGSTTAHLFIDNPFKKRASSFITSLFSTHPPAAERIKILRSM